MENVIKFRCWYNNKMHDNKEAMRILYNNATEIKLLSLNDVVIMQFTRRKDLQGVDIYDKCIMEWPDRDKVDGKPMRFYVTWHSDNQGSGWKFYNKNDIPAGFCFSHADNGIVIGNMYEHPHLIK